jgi:hypothetical protein
VVKTKVRITSKVISELSVATMVETHFEVDTTTIEVDIPYGSYPSISWEEHC